MKSRKYKTKSGSSTPGFNKEVKNDSNQQFLNINSQTPSYGNFWQSENAGVAPNGPIPFNQTGPTAGGVSLLTPSTIGITEAGDYEINYIVTIIPPPNVTRLSVFLNNVEVPNFQTTFTTLFDDTGFLLEAYQVSGTAIISIPANSTLELRNTSGSVIAFFGRNLQANAAALTVIKLS
ncbi:hypothetical protein [Priestia megaterium]|uniref:hypothetical protein n=1 Tax=Priestia megaterium TaxID=1404 RepID=UPI0012D9F176|nr:hypothetical protein [Priestia megaterium]MUL34774.1 hypothetical protein [Priestia megaterium]